MELRQFLLVISRSRLVVIASCVAGITASAIALIVIPPSFVATSQALVSVEPDGSGASELGEAFEIAQGHVANLVVMGTSSVVLDEVIESLELSEKSVDLAQRVSISNPAGSTVIEVTVTDSSAPRAADVSNDVLRVLRSTAEQGARSAADFSILSRAAVPSEPASPDAIRYIAVGLLAGLGLGVAIALLRHVVRPKGQVSR